MFTISCRVNIHLHMPCKFTNPKIQLFDNAVNIRWFSVLNSASVLIAGLHNARMLESFLFNGELFSGVITCHLYKKILC